MQQKNAVPFLLVISVIIIAGCAQQQEVREITIPGHPEIYSFSNDLREVLRVPVKDKEHIEQLLLVSSNIDVVFNGTSPQDNAYFTIVTLNTVSKIQTYSSNEGNPLGFRSFYFIDGVWYNSSNEETGTPQLETTIWFRGPDTGATETSVSAEENIIYVQGTSYRNLTLAGDRLVLVAFGIEKI